MAESKRQSFTKEQLVASKRFAAKRDIAAAVLADGQSYTIENAEKLINSFLKKRTGGKN
jgi:hypothetical protein